MTKPVIATVELTGPFKILARQIWIKADNRTPPTTGDVISVKAVQAGSSDAGIEAANLINRSGLRDRDGDKLHEHSVDPAAMWRSVKGETACWLEFDLGEAQPLGGICIFNYNDAWYTDHGVRKADISVWTQETGWKKVHDDLAIEQAQGSDDYDEPMFVKLDGVKAQKIRFDDLASFGDPDYIGLSEVQFFGPRGPLAVQPIPHDGATGVRVSGLALAWGPGEGAQTHTIYLGTSPDDLKPLGTVEQAGARLSPLNPDTKYFWRIDEVRADGSLAAGKTWSFTTGGFAAWWKLDETEGTMVADSSGNSHDAAIHGNPTWQPQAGRIGGALQFDGVDDYVDTGWTPQLPTWTLAAWVRSPAAPVPPMASGPVHCEENFQLSWNHGDEQCRGAAVVRVRGTWHSAGFGELKPDTWYHLLATYDGENLKAYKDGVLITDKADPSGDADSGPSTLKFGRHAKATDAFFTGTVDDVRVYSYALTADEIRSLVAGETSPAPVSRQVTLLAPPAEKTMTKSLAAWWKLDEGIGDLAHDASGSGNHGVIRGGPAWVKGPSESGLLFDGVDDYIDCGSDDGLMQVGSVSVAAWIQLAVVARDGKVASNQNEGSGYKLGVHTNNKIEFEIRTDPEVSATLNRNVEGGTVLQQGVWYHVVGVYEKGRYIRTYVNGQLDREMETAEVAAASSGRLLIGREPFANIHWWQGALRDVCVFTYALSPEDVKALYSGTEPTAVAARVAASAPTVAQATPPQASESSASTPVPAAPAPPQAQIQPVSAQPPLAEARPQGSRNWIALIVIVGIVGAIAGASFFAKGTR